MDMAAILFSSAKLFEQIVSIAWQKTPCEIWWKFVKWFHRRHLNIFIWFYKYIKPKGKGRYSQGIKFWS